MGQGDKKQDSKKEGDKKNQGGQGGGREQDRKNEGSHSGGSQHGGGNR